MFQWAGFDPSVAMAPLYPFPVSAAVPPGPIPLTHPLQPIPYFGDQNPGAIPNPCSTSIQYSAPTNPQIEKLSTQFASSSHDSSKQDSRNKSLDRQNGNDVEKSSDSNDAATVLELKKPGSSIEYVVSRF